MITCMYVMLTIRMSDQAMRDKTPYPVAGSRGRPISRLKQARNA